jgi:hypothetical protein
MNGGAMMLFLTALLRRLLSVMATLVEINITRIV